jgi:4-hydroxyproline epimerase
MQPTCRGTLAVGDEFIHESIIGTMFEGRVEAAAKVGNHTAIIPSIAGWARTHGINTIFVNARDPVRAGFLG